VAACDLDWPHSDEELVRALDASLPADLAVHEAQMVDATFHPRFDALYRCYRYRLFCQPVRDPLRERFYWRVWPEISEKALIKTAQLFLGKHDFSAFGSPTTPRGSTVRTVMKAEWTQAGSDEWYFDVQADAFLYRMVRRLAFVQVAVAQGKVSAEIVARSLAKPASATSKNEKVPAGLAPAHGLTLVQVAYPHPENTSKNIESIGQ
jgi:tRNA pseudouridine38-40 synthase